MKVRASFLVSMLVVVILSVAGVGFYLERVAPFRTTVLVVGKERVSMSYFLKRVWLSGADPLNTLQNIAKEQIIKQVAPNSPYNFTVHEEQIDELLRNEARIENAAATDQQYAEWYQQQLNESGLTTSEFRDLTRTTLLAQSLESYLARRVSRIAPQVHLHLILVDEFEAAREAKARLDAGADFARLARDLSSNDRLGSAIGDVGWFPRTGLASDIGQVAFEELDIGEVSEPVQLGDERFGLIMVSERATAREIDEMTFQRIKTTVLRDWIQEQYQHFDIEIHGLKNGYDSETDAWVREQVHRMNP